MTSPNKIFDLSIVNFKTYADYPTKLPLKRNLVQNSSDLKVYKDSLSFLDLHVINIIRGGLLGDLTGIRRSNAPTDSLKIEQKYDRKDYVDHLYNVLFDFTGSPPMIRNIKGGGASDRQSYWFRTYGHSELEKIITPFYKWDSEQNKYIKIIPDNINEWLNECVLAYWFMDDGSKTKNTYYLHTQSFTLEDQHKLQIALSGLGLQSSIKKDKISNNNILYKLEIDKNYNALFSFLIKPYILPIFYYKL